MKNRLFIILIFVLSLFLRVYRLDKYPAGFLWDEAAIGYNAYSILKTAKDEHGQFLPVIFKSFGDYKPGLYIYLTIPSILIFGLNEFAVRFSSAMFGSLTILILYFLVEESLKTEFLLVGKRVNKDLLPLICSLLLAINPWHINFSRGSWEVNVMLFELVLGFYLLMKFLNSKKNYLLFLHALVFIFSLLTYQSAKFIAPVLVFGFIFFFRKSFFPVNKKIFSLFLLLISLSFVVFNLYTFWSGKSGRIKVMSVFSYPRSPEETQLFLGQDNNNKLVFYVFHGSPVFFLRSVAGRYFNYFSGKFLFVSGDWSNERNGIIYQGALYYIDLLFLLFGLYSILSKEKSALSNFMLFWLAIAPLPAALTRDSISSVRSLTMIIPLIYIISVGIDRVFIFTGKFSRGIKLTFYLLPFTFYIFFLIRFLDLYLIHDRLTTSENRLYGYKEMVNYINPMTADKNKVVITSYYGQPYIFYLFYTKYDPAAYQKKVNFIDNPYGDVGRVDNIDNIEFRRIYWPSDRNIKNSLFVGNESDLPIYDIVGQENITLLKEVKFLNDKTAFRIVETK